MGDQKDGEEDIDIEASDEEMEEDEGDNEGGDKTETDANKVENGEVSVHFEIYYVNSCVDANLVCVV